MRKGRPYESHDRGAIVSTPYGLGKIIDAIRKSKTDTLDFVVQILGKEVALRMKSNEFRKI